MSLPASAPEPTPEPTREPTREARDSGPTGSAELCERDGSFVVLLHGEIDDELRPDLDDIAMAVASRPDGPVRVDAAAVTFMDSAGAAFLARLAVAVRPAKLAVRASQPVSFLLDLTRLVDVVDVVPAAS